MSSTLNLGQRLADSTAAEKAGTLAAQRAAAARDSAERAEKFATVERFFEEARQRFVADIEAGLPMKDIGVQCGRSHGYSRHTGSDHAEVYSILSGWDYTHELMKSLQPRGAYSSLWEKMVQWGVDNGLRVHWAYEHDGGGMCSWWVLRVAPAEGLTAQQSLPDESALLTELSAAQAALAELSTAYLDAVNALRTPREPSRGATHLHRHAAVIRRAQSIRALLGKSR